MLNNIDIAIMTKLNELTERYGLKPCDFVATVKPDRKRNGMSDAQILAFEVSAQGNKLRVERFEKLLQALGVDANGLLKGSDAHIIDALDHALQLAPKQRPRF